MDQIQIKYHGDDAVFLGHLFDFFDSPLEKVTHSGFGKGSHVRIHNIRFMKEYAFINLPKTFHSKIGSCFNRYKFA